ncbi:MAG TPA: 2-oxoacid:acceptor oxidoreductase subunit alpha [Plasticicumulans sp.]|nr:2-oxoacid:acceptor oxidoreductase subunit alpha [Plasticicumulans sp.]
MDPSLNPQSVSIVLCGSGGAGVMTAGQMLLDAAAAAGLYGVMSRALGPQIRGGEAAALLRLANHPVEAPDDAFDVLLAVDWQNIERFAAELPLRADSLVIGDPAAGELPAAILRAHPRRAEVALQALADETGSRVNMVALGLLAELIGLPAEAVYATLAAALADKGEAVVESGIRAALAGAQVVAALPAVPRLPAVAAAANRPVRWSLSGNEASGLGALRGGVRFVAAYPITPATEILEWLAPRLPPLGGCLVQAEDELASVNMILGGAFGGVPSLTATSGPGLALMTESLGLGVASETPVVVCNVMRGGPSTGIPTKSEQSDLDIALHGLHGDAPHLVTAATGIADCAFTTQWTVQLAEALQVPAIVLSDQAMGQSRAVVDALPDPGFRAVRLTAPAGVEGYQRYAVTESGVSPMAVPGTPGGSFVADGLEHAPRGTPSTQAAHHREQLDKRHRKLEVHDYGEHWALLEGARDAETAVICFGSLTAAAREAVDRLNAAGTQVRLISLRLLAPALPLAFAAALRGVRHALVVEQNHSRQFLGHLRSHYPLQVHTHGYHRPGPVAIRPGEIVAAVRSLLAPVEAPVTVED